MFSTQRYFGFDPRTIPGCQLWLDGADPNVLFTDSAGTTLVGSSGNIGLWRDKSLSARNYIQTTSGNRPSFANNTVTCSTSPQLLTSTPALAITGIDIFVVGKPLPAAGNSWRTLFRGGTTDHPFMVETGATRIGYYVNSVNTFYPFGSLTLDGSTRVLIYVTIPATRIASAALNGTNALSAGTAAMAAAADFQTLGNSIGGGQPWGDINEVILVSNTTSSHRKQIEGYLAWKWGTQASLPLGHPYRQNPLGMRIFQPTDISNCILWLDGRDARMVSVSGTNVTAWNDKSGLGNNLTTVSTTRPTYSSTTGAITFTSGSGTAIRGALNTSYTNPASLFVVSSIRIDANAVFNPRFVVLGTNGTSVTFMAGQFNVVINQNTGSAPVYGTYANTNLNPTGVGQNIQTAITTSPSTVGIYANQSTYSGTNLTNNTFLNGNTSTFSAVNTTWTATAPYVTSYAYVALGNNTNGSASGGDCFSGDIYEVLLFSRTVTVAERQQIEGYLAAKWRLSSLLPTAHPYRLLRALPSTPLFTPTELSGLRLWLDAADPSQLFSDSGGTTLVGPSGNVGLWRDKSGFGRNYAQATSGIRPTLSNNTVTTTNDTGQFLSNATTLAATSLDLFVVGKPHSVTGTRFRSFFRDNLAADLALLLPPTNTSSVLGYYTGASLRSFTGITVPGTARALIYVSYSAARVPSAAINGTGTLVAGPIALTTNSQFDFLGGRPDAVQPWGEMNEVILVSNTTLQIRQRVEGYLAWKWGLQNNLPVTHPYYKFRP